MTAEEAFQKNLNRLMNDRGMPPKSLARTAGVSIQTVYDAKSGQHVPSVTKAWRMAQGLNVSLMDFMRGATE